MQLALMAVLAALLHQPLHHSIHQLDCGKHHAMMDGVNRLGVATSPYLLQHASNPVDWWEWGEDAFAEARRRDVPVLLSVGYAACHWCHVMAHESFEDAETAATINAGFVPIKVDREERPDVDAVYMTATQAMTGQGGWPMTVFLTPDGDPIYAGTYFPAQPFGGMPAFGQVLDAVSRSWTDRTEEIRTGAAQISDRLRDAAPQNLAGEPTAADALSAVDKLWSEYDVRHGGFGDAPKFPPSMVLQALLRITELGRNAPRPADLSESDGRIRPSDSDNSGSAWPEAVEKAEQMARGTLDAMAHGGIYDQLGGGFARYSVDAGWQVPHYEKMITDNALLLGCYTQLWRITGCRDDRVREVVSDTAEWMIAEMRTPEGGFARSLAADSPDSQGRLSEGAYYLWSRDQLVAAIGTADADWISQICRLDPASAQTNGSTLQLADLDDDAHDRWRRIRDRLRQARNQRERPAQDDKIIAGWNGLVIAALAQAGAIFDRPDWLQAASEAGELVWRLHWTNGRLRRTSRARVAGRGDGVAEDYADLGLGYAWLAETTAEPVWAQRARTLLDVLTVRFAAPGGGFYDTADDAEELINRPSDPTDNAVPSGLSAAIMACGRLARYTGDGELARASQRAAESTGRLQVTAPRFAGWQLADTVTRLAGSAVEVAIVGKRDDGTAAELALLARRQAPAGSVVVNGPADAGGVPLLAGRTMIDAVPTGYVCRHFVCDLPVTTANGLAGQLLPPGLPQT